MIKVMRRSKILEDVGVELGESNIAGNASAENGDFFVYSSDDGGGFPIYFKNAGSLLFTLYKYDKGGVEKNKLRLGVKNSFKIIINGILNLNTNYNVILRDILDIIIELNKLKGSILFKVKVNNFDLVLLENFYEFIGYVLDGVKSGNVIDFLWRVIDYTVRFGNFAVKKGGSGGSGSVVMNKSSVSNLYDVFKRIFDVFREILKLSVSEELKNKIEILLLKDLRNNENNFCDNLKDLIVGGIEKFRSFIVSLNKILIRLSIVVWVKDTGKIIINGIKNYKGFLDKLTSVTSDDKITALRNKIDKDLDNTLKDIQLKNLYKEFIDFFINYIGSEKVVEIIEKGGDFIDENLNNLIKDFIIKRGKEIDLEKNYPKSLKRLFEYLKVFDEKSLDLKVFKSGGTVKIVIIPDSGDSNYYIELDNVKEFIDSGDVSNFVKSFEELNKLVESYFSDKK